MDDTKTRYALFIGILADLVLEFCGRKRKKRFRVRNGRTFVHWVMAEEECGILQDLDHELTSILLGTDDYRRIA